jgi:hypothetical protein
MFQSLIGRLRTHNHRALSDILERLGDNVNHLLNGLLVAKLTASHAQVSLGKVLSIP